MNSLCRLCRLCPARPMQNRIEFHTNWYRTASTNFWGDEYCWCLIWFGRHRQFTIWVQTWSHNMNAELKPTNFNSTKFSFFQRIHTLFSKMRKCMTTITANGGHAHPHRKRVHDKIHATFQRLEIFIVNLMPAKNKWCHRNEKIYAHNKFVLRFRL